MVASFSNKPPPSIPSMPDFTMPPPGMPPMPPGFSAGKFYIVYTTMDTLDSKSDVSSSPIKGPRCFLEQETLL